MEEYEIEIAAVVPVYGKVKVKAATQREAHEIAARIARQGWNDPDLPIGDFVPEWDAMKDFEVYRVDGATPEAPADKAA